MSDDYLVIDTLVNSELRESVLKRVFEDETLQYKLVLLGLRKLMNKRVVIIKLTDKGIRAELNPRFINFVKRYAEPLANKLINDQLHSDVKPIIEEEFNKLSHLERIWVLTATTLYILLTPWLNTQQTQLSTLLALAIFPDLCAYVLSIVSRIYINKVKGATES